MLTWQREARLCSITDKPKNPSGLQQQCPLWTMSIMSVHITFISIWNNASCCGRAQEYTGKPLLVLEVSTGKVVAQIVLSKVSNVRILTQRREANNVESITNVLLKYFHPLMSLELVSYCPRSQGSSTVFFLLQFFSQ